MFDWPKDDREKTDNKTEEIEDGFINKFEGLSSVVYAGELYEVLSNLPNNVLVLKQKMIETFKSKTKHLYYVIKGLIDEDQEVKIFDIFSLDTELGLLQYNLIEFVLNLDELDTFSRVELLSKMSNILLTETPQIQSQRYNRFDEYAFDGLDSQSIISMIERIRKVSRIDGFKLSYDKSEEPSFYYSYDRKYVILANLNLSKTHNRYGDLKSVEPYVLVGVVNRPVIVDDDKKTASTEFADLYRRLDGKQLKLHYYDYKTILIEQV